MAKVFVPFENYILVAPTPPETKSEHGILFPEGFSMSAFGLAGEQSRMKTGTVVEIGDDFSGIETGDRIFYSRPTVQLALDGNDYDLVEKNDIFGIYIDEDDEGGSGDTSAPVFLAEEKNIRH